MSQSSPTTSPSSPPGGHLQRAATVSGNAAWILYRSYLSGPVANIIPQPTRDALFQLFCDLKANVPKDKKFLQRHARAFKPDSTLGWLALSGVLGSLLSASLVLSTLTLGISIAGVTTAVVAIMCLGMFLASALSFLAFILCTSAFVVGAVSLSALSGVAVGKASFEIIKYIMQLVFGEKQGILNFDLTEEKREHEDGGLGGESDRWCLNGSVVNGSNAPKGHEELKTNDGSGMVVGDTADAVVVDGTKGEEKKEEENDNDNATTTTITLSPPIAQQKQQQPSPGTTTTIRTNTNTNRHPPPLPPPDAAAPLKLRKTPEPPLRVEVEVGGLGSTSPDHHPLAVGFEFESVMEVWKKVEAQGDGSTPQAVREPAPRSSRMT